MALSEGDFSLKGINQRVNEDFFVPPTASYKKLSCWKFKHLYDSSLGSDMDLNVQMPSARTVSLI